MAPQSRPRQECSPTFSARGRLHRRRTYGLLHGASRPQIHYRVLRRIHGCGQRARGLAHEAAAALPVSVGRRAASLRHQTICA